MIASVYGQLYEEMWVYIFAIAEMATVIIQSRRMSSHYYITAS